MTKYTLHTDPIGRHQFRRLDGIALSALGALDELNELLARAEAAEAERDELKRKFSQGEAERRAPDWERVRIDAAIAAMQGILASNAWPTKPVAQSAIEYSSELVAELKKEVAD